MKTKQVQTENGYSILNGAKYLLGKKESQNYFVFQRVNKDLKLLKDDVVRAWKSKGLSNESIKFFATSDISLNPLLDHFKNSKF